MGFERVAKLINHQGSFAHAAEAALICVMIERAIKEISPELSKEVQIISFQEGTAKLKITSASASSEFQMNSKRIIEKTNYLIGNPQLNRFTYKIS